MKRGKIISGIILAVLLVCLITLYATTGFLQRGNIDALDIEKWQYVDGVISKAQGFTLEGSSGECWVMIHGYTSTPDELRRVAEVVHEKFNDTVYVPRLYGHGELPSHLELYSVEEWYLRAEEMMDKHRCSYMLGSSMGASIALRYAEEHQLNGVVLLGLMLKQAPEYLPVETLMRRLYPIVRYAKKTEPGGTIISPEGKKEHISTYTFPLKGAVELVLFNKKLDISKVNSSILFVHARDDTVAAFSGAKNAFDRLNTTKEFVELLEGNHIIMRDFGREKAIEEIIRFREQIASAAQS